MKKQFGERKLYTLEHPKSTISEAFRMLRTNLTFTNVDRELHTILFTSSGPQEGKSVVVSNLAVALAQTGENILLMDCDLRKPVQNEIFNLSNRIGMTNLLTGLCTLEEIVQSTELPNLQVLTSGPVPPNPAELLGSKAMEKLLEDVKDRYDVVLLDSPPVVAVADPAILGTKCDGVIVVVRSGYTKIIALKETKEILTKSNAHIIGVVLNDADFNGRYYYKRYGKYYNSNYQHYYQE